MNPAAPFVDPSILFYLAFGIVLVIAVIVFALKTPQRPVIHPDEDAMKRAQLDVATRLGKSPSVIRPRQGNGRL